MRGESISLDRPGRPKLIAEIVKIIAGLRVSSEPEGDPGEEGHEVKEKDGLEEV